MNSIKYGLSLFISTLVIFQSCNAPDKTQENKKVNALQTRVDSLIKRVDSLEKSALPGIGPLMLILQTHHTKLGLALNKGNWQLADFELEEVEEDFIRLSNLYPVYPGFASPTEQYVKTYIAPSIEQLEEFCDKKDTEKMRRSYKLLTAGCNSCHRETKHPFNVIIEPVQSAFPDQKFENE
jgi:hypothetical protein